MTLDAQMRIDEEVANVPRESTQEIVNRHFRSTQEDSGSLRFDLLDEDYGANDAALAVARRMLIRLPAGERAAPPPQVR